MLEEIYKDTKDRMGKSIEAVGREFAGVSTGKASTHILDTVKVDAYGSVVPLNQLATVSAPEVRLLIVQAFDKTTVGDIVKAIQKADLGLNPMVDGQMIRLPIPQLNEERRKDLVRHCHNLAEEGKIAVRNVRRDANEHIKTLLKDKKISKDQGADGHDRVQEMTDEFCKQVDVMLNAKEKEMLEV